MSWSAPPGGALYFTLASIGKAQALTCLVTGVVTLGGGVKAVAPEPMVGPPMELAPELLGVLLLELVTTRHWYLWPSSTYVAEMVQMKGCCAATVSMPLSGGL
jgi:hypothetical protein